MRVAWIWTAKLFNKLIMIKTRLSQLWLLMLMLIAFLIAFLWLKKTKNKKKERGLKRIKLKQLNFTSKKIILLILLYKRKSNMKFQILSKVRKMEEMTRLLCKTINKVSINLIFSPKTYLDMRHKKSFPFPVI